MVGTIWYCGRSWYQMLHVGCLWLFFRPQIKDLFSSAEFFPLTRPGRGVEVGSFQSMAPWDGLQSLLMWLSRPFWEGPELPCKLQTQACHKRGLGLHEHCCLWPANKPCGAEQVHLVIILRQTTGPCPRTFTPLKTAQ